MPAARPARSDSSVLRRFVKILTSAAIVLSLGSCGADLSASSEADMAGDSTRRSESLRLVSSSRDSGHATLTPKQRRFDESHGLLLEKITPTSVAFWDERHGLLLGKITTRRCRATRSCEHAINRTSDAGETWRTVARGITPYLSVATLGHAHAWVTVGRCADREGCSSGVLATRDRGESWKRISEQRVFEPSFATFKIGWAVKSSSPYEGKGRLAVTADGGRSWEAAPSPCPRREPRTKAVSAARPGRAWVFCNSEASTAQMGKAVMHTDDGGESWRLIAETSTGLWRDRFPDDGIFSSGHATGIFFRPESTGWMWGGRGLFQITHDGGRTWHAGGRRAVDFDISDVDDLWFVSRDVGYALVSNRGLMRSASGGVTWSMVLPLT